MKRNPVYNDMLDIDDISVDFDETDQKCFEEIRKVLFKFKREKKFGINLLHKHFNLKDGEIIMEVQDIENRKLTSSPVTKQQLERLGIKNYRPTSWRLDLNSITAISNCPFGMYGQHYGYKD